MGVGGEGLVVEERGSGKGKREGESEREAKSAEAAAGTTSWVRQL